MSPRRRSQRGSHPRVRDLVVEVLEGRRLLAANVVVANEAGPSSTPLVRLVDAETGVEQSSVLAFESTFRGGVRVAMGRVTGNAAPDVVVGSGSGRVSEVRVYRPVTSGSTTTLTQVMSFQPFGPSYRGGVEVVVGDVDGDTVEDIVVSKSREGGDVKVFRMTNPGGTLTRTVYATISKPFGATYNGGSSVGVADVGEFTDGAFVKSVADNKVEILVGSGAGITAQVKVYDVSRPASPRVADTIVPFGPLFAGGVSVTSGRYAASGVADSIDDIAISAGRGGASQTRVFDGTVGTSANTVLKSFSTFATLGRPNAAVHTAAVDTDGNGQVDRFLQTQGDPGGPAGISNVSIAGVRSATPVTSLAGPLRIAAARTVFQSQTINGTVSTPSPTAGIAAGASRPMQIREIVTGTGATANVGNTLTVQYTGMLTNGSVFDTSRQPGRTPFQLTLGAGSVIAGWEAGLVGMQVGGRRLLVIPPELAYGDTARTGIPAGSTLVFDVELVGVSGNATASIGGTSTGSLTEDGTPDSVGGTLTVTDPDAGQSSFATPGSLAGTYGTFTFVPATGVWGYALDNARSATQALTAGQTVTDSLLVTSVDGTASRTIVVTITGAGDAPTAIALSAAAVAEDAAVGTAVGTLSTTDVDAGDTFTYTLVSGEGDTGNGSFTIDGAVLKTAAAFDFETQGSYSIRVRSTDANGGTFEKVFTITVTDVNDVASISGPATGAVSVTDETPVASGTLTVTDPDAGQATFQAPSSLAGTYGDFTFNGLTGAWTYTLDTTTLRRYATWVLTADRPVTESLTVTSSDGTASETIEVTITGHAMQTLSATVATPSPSAAVEAGSTSSLEYRDVGVGDGAVAQPGDLLTVNYIGYLDDGSLFDSSLLPGRSPFQFVLGVGAVIPGWDAGVEGMQVGGVRVLVIPPELAYGDAGQGSIPGDARLSFLVELLAVTPPAP